VVGGEGKRSKGRSGPGSDSQRKAVMPAEIASKREIASKPWLARPLATTDRSEALQGRVGGESRAGAGLARWPWDLARPGIASPVTARIEAERSEATAFGRLAGQKKGAKPPEGPSKEPKHHQKQRQSAEQAEKQRQRQERKTDRHEEPRQAGQARKPNEARKHAEQPQTDQGDERPNERKAQPDGATGSPQQPQSQRKTEKTDEHRSQKSPKGKRTEKPEKLKEPLKHLHF